MWFIYHLRKRDKFLAVEFSIHLNENNMMIVWQVHNQKILVPTALYVFMFTNVTELIASVRTKTYLYDNNENIDSQHDFMVIRYLRPIIVRSNDKAAGFNRIRPSAQFVPVARDLLHLLVAGISFVKLNLHLLIIM